MNIYRKLTLGLIFALAGLSAKAQLDPLGAQFYTNQYIANPAFAGITQGLKINGVYRKLWNNVPGAPLTQNLTADYGFNKVGLGLNVNNESAGLQKQVRVVGSYAYHLPLSADNAQQLHFGVSLGFANQRLENADINGDPTDPMIGMYNTRRTYLDGDFGVAFTSNGLNIQGAIPNLKSLFKKETVRLADVATFYAAASYQFVFNQGMNAVGLEPKVAYRGVQGYDNIWDAGAQLSLVDRQVLLTGLYHSTESSTFGLGMDFKRKYLITGLYTTQTSALSGYTNGSFELNLRVALGK